jgi:hypothetical protein
MSKTVSEIGLIVGGIALALASGPIGIGMVGSLQVMNAMIGIGASSALAGVGLALRPTPKPAGITNTISFATGSQYRRVGYGQFLTPPLEQLLTYASFPPGQNLSTTGQYLHLVATIAAHEITSFDAVVINGTVYNFQTDIIQQEPVGNWEILPGSSGSVNDFYYGHIFFEFDAGNANNAAPPFPNLTASDPAWTSACMQRGCAKVHVVLRADVGWTAVFPSGQIPDIRFLVTGKKILDPRVNTAWLASTNTPHDSYIIDGNSNIWVQMNSGATVTGATRPAFETNTIGATLTDNSCSWHCAFALGAVYAQFSATMQGWNGRIVNDGWQPGTGYAVYTIIESPIGYFQMVASGSGNSGATHPNFSTALGGTTADSGLGWVCLGRSPNAANPSNAALIVNDYLQDTDAGLSVAPSTIDESSVIAAANVCEEQVAIIVASTGTVYENLYACDGMFDHSSVRGNVLSALCASMAGWVIPPGDMWRVFAGAYVTPTVSLGDKDLRGPIKGDFRLSAREVANSMKGTYAPSYLPTNPAAALALTQVPSTWQTQSYPPYQANGSVAGKPNYLNTEDGGQVIWQDLNLDFTKSLWMAQRLAKIGVMRLRFQQTHTLPFKLTALAAGAGDTFEFTHTRWGISNGVFQAENSNLVFDGSGGKDSVPALGVDLVGRQVDPSIYTFIPPSSPTNYGEYSPYGITGVMTGVE